MVNKHDSGFTFFQTGVLSNVPLFAKVYGLTQADEIGALLGGMQLLDDGTPADPALLADWAQAVETSIAS